MVQIPFEPLMLNPIPPSFLLGVRDAHPPYTAGLFIEKAALNHRQLFLPCQRSPGLPHSWTVHPGGWTSTHCHRTCRCANVPERGGKTAVSNYVSIQNERGKHARIIEDWCQNKISTDNPGQSIWFHDLCSQLKSLLGKWLPVNWKHH